MVGGAPGKLGPSAVHRVGSEYRVVQEGVQAQRHLAAEKTALETAWNQVLVMRASAQVSSIVL